MTTRTRRKCRHCGQLFRPAPRNLRHQRYCSAKECRRASKAASQRRWLAKAENRGYFRGPEQMARVRAWRAAHPGYARKKSSRRPALQEHSSAQPADIDEQSDVLSVPALQDVSLAQTLELTGLIAPPHRRGVTRRHRHHLAPASTIGPRHRPRRPRWSRNDCCAPTAGDAPPRSSAGSTTA